MNSIRIYLLFFFVVLNLTSTSCKNNSLSRDVANVISRNDKFNKVDKTKLASQELSSVTDLHRFHLAQSASQLAADYELSKGEKSSHWIWYIFPQIEGFINNPSSTNKIV
jgi:hypothetical protein